jgi:hypothetical protein
LISASAAGAAGVIAPTSNTAKRSPLGLRPAADLHVPWQKRPEPVPARRATACRRAGRVAAVGLNRVGGLDGQSIGLDDIGKAGAVFGLLADAGGKVGHRRLVAFGGEGEDDFRARLIERLAGVLLDRVDARRSSRARPSSG